jgi:hypothetical protein
LAGVPHSPDAAKKAKALAEDAIRRDPIAPVSLRALALVAEESGATQTSAMALMRQANRLSRRDRAAQIWLVERNIREGQYRTAVQHLDVAMLTSRADRETLFSLLAGASVDPRMAAIVADRLRQRPEWALPFMIHLVEHNSDPDRTAYFARNFLDPSLPGHLQVLRGLVQWLGSREEYSLAWNIHRDFQLGGKRKEGGVIDGGFEASSGYEPFGWWLSREGDLWADVERDPVDGKGNVLRLVASSGRSGDVARQLIHLDPGQYRFSAREGDIPEDRFERPALRLRCAEKQQQRELLAITPRTGAAKQEPIEGDFSVPDGCQFQWLTISVANDGPQMMDPPWIDDIQITRISG